MYQYIPQNNAFFPNRRYFLDMDELLYLRVLCGYDYLSKPETRFIKELSVAPLRTWFNLNPSMDK